MSTSNEKLTAVNGRLMGLFKADQKTMMGFKSLADAAVRPGKLSPAIKELTAVAIAVAKGCDDCIIYHVAAAKKHGASREELVEMLAVSVEMSGGPGAVYAGRALECFDGLA
ncbi:MAG: carboxymuconolactone decarboxylase family protein [Alphaproteobacteria bacterium]|nr:carboxymuconolactone decarboxylase family protein [Alphaproteobacteria bacterium]